MDEILNGKTVLAVDDTAVMRMLVADILKPAGVTLLEAASGEQALQRANENAIDAFLLDIRLPDMNGIELCRALRAMERYRNTPIVFVTAMDQREILQWALKAGCDDFIQKPIHAMVLRKRLGNLLQKAAYLKRYKRRGAEAGWHFLVGDKPELDRLTAAVGFRYAWDERTKQWAHPSGVVTLTPQGRISHYLFGIEYAPKDLRLSLVEAAQGNIGTAVDQVLLYCYQYDPATGKYGAAVMRLLRATSVLTVIALAGFILAMWRRERRAHG